MVMQPILLRLDARETAKPLMPFANASVSCAVIGDMTHAITAMTTAAGRKIPEILYDSLSGWRLMAYLMNNHWNDLYTPKYFWKGMKGRKSRIFVDTCPLTGYYIDNDILDPIYKFLKSPTGNVTFDNLMNNCLDSFFRACRDDMRAPRLWNTSRKKATPTVGNTFQTENYSINYQHLKTYHYEDGTKKYRRTTYRNQRKKMQ